jgi:hypothetical protein
MTSLASQESAAFKVKKTNSINSSRLNLVTAEPYNLSKERKRTVNLQYLYI